MRRRDSRKRSSAGVSVRPWRSGLRRDGLAADLLARSLGHVFPGNRIVVDRALPGACVLAGGAIVLSGLGDAEAFVFAGVRRYRGSRDRGREAKREQARYRRLNRGLLLHECLLTVERKKLNESGAKDGRFRPSGPLVAGALATLHYWTLR